MVIIIMKRFASDDLLYVYKTYKVIKLYWHVSLYIILYKLTSQNLLITL